MQLSMMVPGITANTVTDTPGISGLTNFQLNLDGQEITQHTSVTTFGQPGISREAIAEYQVVTNMFDVTAGRSAGIQVQAITRAGTNDLAGSVYGYFRDDKFNAADAYLNRVLPYSNSQIGGTLGGPIVQNKMHYFGSYEREREPNTAVISPAALAPQLITMPIEEKKDYYLGRFDAQFGSQGSPRGARQRLQALPAQRRRHRPPEPRHQEGHHVVFGHRDLVARHATATCCRSCAAASTSSTGPTRAMDGLILTPEYQFPGLILGLNWNYPEFIRETRYPFRYDLTWNVGTHDLKIGGEWMYAVDDGDWPARERGQYLLQRAAAGRRTRASRSTRIPRTGTSAASTRPCCASTRPTRSEWTYNVPRPRYAALDRRHLDGQRPAHAEPGRPLRRGAGRLHRPGRDGDRRRHRQRPVRHERRLPEQPARLQQRRAARRLRVERHGQRRTS